MSKMYKILLATLFAGITFNASAQYWSSRSDVAGVQTDKAVARQTFPKEFKAFSLSLAPLKQQLMTVVDKGSRVSTVISIPNAAGNLEQFQVFEASNFAPELQARFPEIRAFSGKGLTDRYATLKLSISPQGIQTMVFRVDAPNEYIEPYSADHTIYAVFKSHRSKGGLPWVCSTPEQAMADNLNQNVYNSRIESNTGNLKTMRLAQSCNGEYSNWFGAFNSSQVGLVLAAFNATLTRCNGCYEKDLAIHLNLVPESVNVIYYDPATDPYTSLANWNTQLQIALNTTLTGPGTTLSVNNAAYDIGHMFGASGGGGNAGCIGCVCVDGTASGGGSTKGRGITSPADGIPQGDNFDIDYVAHEVGHQMGGNHTFSHALEGSGQNKEVGSGITIMGYAGITGFDVAPHSIDIFHETSIQQIQVNIAGKACPLTFNLAGVNATPVVAPVSNYTIPITTPFALTGSATDADGDPITYNWEQNDNATTSGAQSVASPTKLTGPNWLSFPSTASGIRTCPRLATILAGNSVTGPLPGGDAVANIEALSSVGRTLNFRLTVRDNAIFIPGTKVAQTQFTDMVVTVSTAVGPFLIQSQNSAVSYAATSSQTVTWSVNGTTGPPTNTANVNILWSTDGGQNFTMLVANTPNDGTENITIPNTLTTQARVKVESIGNIYFDINNANITVTAPPNGFSFNNPSAVSGTCPVAGPMVANLTATYFGVFNNPITLSATAFPAGTNVTFGTNPLTPATNSTTVNLNNTSALTPGNYTVTVQGVATGAPNQTVNITFTVNPGTGPAVTSNPTSQTICAGQNTAFSSTSPTATSVKWQVSTDGGGSWSDVIDGGVYGGATTGTLALTNVPSTFTGYQYRMVASAQCGSTNSGVATLTVNVSASISNHPANVTLCAGANHTFSVTASGTNLTYQWEFSTDGGGSWNDVVDGGVYGGATTANLTLTGITAGMNNYQYRVRVAGGGICNAPVTSNAATLSVVTAVAVTTQPTNQTVCAGGNTSFTVAGSGAGVIYQWQVSTDGGGAWSNVSNGGVYGGATSATLTISGATVSMNGYQYRAQLSNATCTTPGISNAATLTVNSLPAVVTNPNNSTICLGGNTTFTGAGSGTGVAYQWQVSTDGGGSYSDVSNGGVYGGATTGTLTITGATASMNGYRYRLTVSGTCPPSVNTTAATLTVINPVAVTAQPAASVICSGANTSFSVTGSSVETIIYQWQVSTDAGGSWNNVTNSGVYSGATTSTLNLTGVPVSFNSYLYRVQMSSATCGAPTTSNTALLTVRLTPTVTLSAAPLTSLLPGQTTTLTVAQSAPAVGATQTISWQYNGAASTITGNSYVADVEHVGTYQVFIQAAYTGPTIVCSNQSQIVTITATASSRLFIFPTPNDGRFTVSYFNNGGASTSRQIAIFDSKGSLVYNRKFSIVGAYTLIPIDMRQNERGIFYVVVGDANGKKLADGKVHVR